jgi:hypothetical protein
MAHSNTTTTSKYEHCHKPSLDETAMSSQEVTRYTNELEASNEHKHGMHDAKIVYHATTTTTMPIMKAAQTTITTSVREPAGR